MHDAHAQLVVVLILFLLQLGEAIRKRITAVHARADDVLGEIGPLPRPLPHPGLGGGDFHVVEKDLHGVGDVAHERARRHERVDHGHVA